MAPPLKQPNADRRSREIELLNRDMSLKNEQLRASHGERCRPVTALRTDNEFDLNRLTGLLKVARS